MVERSREDLKDLSYLGDRRMKSVILVLRKVADVFKLNDEK